MTKCLTKIAREHGWDAVLEADVMGSRYLGDFNERVERLGYEDATAQKIYAKGQFWLDRYNKLTGNA